MSSKSMVETDIKLVMSKESQESLSCKRSVTISPEGKTGWWESTMSTKIEGGEGSLTQPGKGTHAIVVTQTRLQSGHWWSCIFQRNNPLMLVCNVWDRLTLIITICLSEVLIWLEVLHLVQQCSKKVFRVTNSSFLQTWPSSQAQNRSFTLSVVCTAFMEKTTPSRFLKKPTT